MNCNDVNNTEWPDEQMRYDDACEYDGYCPINADCSQRQGNDAENAEAPPNPISVNRAVDTVGKFPFCMITLAASFAVGASSCHEIIINQFLYNNFANEILGNNSYDTTRHPCGNRSSNNSDLDTDVKDIQDKTSHLYLLLNITSYGLGMFTNVLLGTYSIVLHRRAQILIPTFGYTLRCTVLLVVAYWKLDVYWLFLGFACDGLCGTFTGIFLATFLYSTDVTPRNGKRTIGIAIIEGVKGIMSGSTKILTGFLLGNNDFVLPSIVTLGLLLIALILMCGLPNHKPELKVSAAKNMSFKNAFLIMTSPFDTKVKEIRRMIFLAMFSFFTLIVVFMGIDKISTLFFMDFPFCWSSVTIGWFSFGRDLGYHLFVIIAVPTFYRCLPGMSLGIIGVFFIMASYVLYALAHTNLQAFMGPILSFGMGVPISLIRGETSKLLKPDVQGPLFACFAVLESICFFTGPVIFINLYRVSLNVYRGLPFFVACAIMIPPFIAMIIHQKISVSYEKNKFIAIAEQESIVEVHHDKEKD